MSGPRADLPVWDWPVRAFHWLLLALVIGQFVTAKLGGNWMIWHSRIGFCVLGLVLFRIVWGFVGGRNARFANFLRGPNAIMASFKGEWSGEGHNPLGALSVVAMLALLAFQAVSGLFANDDILLDGPYANVIGKELSDTITKYHKLSSKLLIGLVALHIAAIVFYAAVKKQNLVGPMIHGGKSSQPAVPGPAWLAPVLIALVAGVVALIVRR